MEWRRALNKKIKVTRGPNDPDSEEQPDKAVLEEARRDDECCDEAPLPRFSGLPLRSVVRDQRDCGAGIEKTLTDRAVSL
jgi:hypothetical protein